VYCFQKSGFIHSDHNTLIMDTFRKISGYEFYRKFLVHGVRPDGRNLQKIRKTTINTGSVSSADGSSFVKVGQTSVIAGVTGEVGLATEQSKDGQIIVNLELHPLCSNRFRPGKPSEQAQVVAEFLNDLITSSSLVSYSKLKMEGGDGTKKYVWYLYVDIYCLNYDGNIQDACVIALLAALKNVRLPTISINEEGKVFTSGDPVHSLSILHYPISVTFGILDEFMLADPTSEEEEILGSSFTIVCNNQGKLCAINKPGGVSLTEEKLKECIERTPFQ